MVNITECMQCENSNNLKKYFSEVKTLKFVTEVKTLKFVTSEKHRKMNDGTSV